jgi:hypothetical protein
MRILRTLATSLFALGMASCASPPSSDPSTVEASCAQQCSGSLATCSSGFKLFPVVAQKQCNDTYDVCIKGCPPRTAATARDPTPGPSAADRLKTLDSLLKSGAITQDEYDRKRKDVLSTL